jgi:hypothetical protein
MKYALARIESLMQLELNPENIKLQHPHPVFLNEYINCLSLQKGFIYNLLLKESINLSKEKELELYIRRLQAGLIKLADTVTRNKITVAAFLPAKTEAELSIYNVYDFALKCFEELLDEIKSNFNQYFNWDEKIPDYYKLRMQSRLGENLKNFLKEYRLAGTDEELLALMIYPIQNFITDSGSKHTTYRQLSYLEILCKEYHVGIDAEKKRISQTEILKLQIYLNYNNHHFFEYYINLIETELDQKDGTAEKLVHLSWWLKTVNQLKQHPTIMHKRDYRPAKEQLVYWLQEEIIFYEKKELLSLKAIPSTASLPDRANNITTVFSVKELALFTKVLLDTGILQTDNKIALINTVAGIINTAKKDEIKAGSLRKNFYTYEEHTKNTLKDHLKNMINQVNEY